MTTLLELSEKLNRTLLILLWPMRVCKKQGKGAKFVKLINLESGFYYIANIKSINIERGQNLEPGLHFYY